MAGRKTDPFITISEAAAILGISRPTVEKRIAERELSGEKIAGRLVVRRASVERYRKRLAEASTAAA